MAKTAAERQQDRRKRLKDTGKKEVLVTLDQEALKALDRLCKNGQGQSEAICNALRQSVAGLAIRETEEALALRLKEEKKIEEIKARTAATMLEIAKCGREVQVCTRDKDGVFRPVRDKSRKVTSHEKS